MNRILVSFLVLGCGNVVAGREDEQEDFKNYGGSQSAESGGASSSPQESGGSQSGGVVGTGGNLIIECGSGLCPHWQELNNPELGDCVHDIVSGVYSEWIYIGISFDVNCGPGTGSVYCWETYGQYYGVRYEQC